MMKKMLAMAGVIAVSATGLVLMGPSADPASANAEGATTKYGETHGDKFRGSWTDLGGVDAGYKIEPGKGDPRGAYELEKPAKFTGLSDTEANYLYQFLAPNDLEPSLPNGGLGLIARDQNVKSYPELTDVESDPLPLGPRDNDGIIVNRKSALLASIFEWYSPDGSREGATWTKEHANRVVSQAKAFAAAAGSGKITLTKEVKDGANGRDGGPNEIGHRAEEGITKVHVTNDAGKPIPYALVRVDSGYWADKSLRRTDENGVLNLETLVRNVWNPETLVVSVVDPRPASIGECSLKVFRSADDSTLSKVITDNCAGSALGASTTDSISFRGGSAGQGGRTGKVLLGEPVLRDVGCGRSEIYRGPPTSDGEPFYWTKENPDAYGVVKIVPRMGYMFSQWVDPNMGDEFRMVDVGPRPGEPCAIDLSTVQNTPEKPKRLSAEGDPLTCTPFDSASYSEIGPTISVPVIPGIVYSAVDDKGYKVGQTRSPVESEIALNWSARVGSIFTVVAEIAPGYVAVDSSVALPTWKVDMGVRPGFCAIETNTDAPYLVRTETCGENLGLIIPPDSIDVPGPYRMAVSDLSQPDFMRADSDLGAPYPPFFAHEYNIHANHFFLRSPLEAVTGPVSVTKVPGPMFMIPATEQTSWQFDLSPQPCAGTDIEVTPVEPEMFTGPDCTPYVGGVSRSVPGISPTLTGAGEAPSIRVPVQEGLEYHYSSLSDPTVRLIPQDRLFYLLWGQDYTITATALPGFVIPEGAQTTWNLKTAKATTCADMGAQPEVQAPATCGVGSTIKTVPFSDEFAPYTWSANPASALTTGATGRVIVTATLKPGHVWTNPDQQTEWVFDLPEIVPCDVIVQTEIPTVEPAQTCGVGARLVLPSTEGVTYTSDRPDAREGIVTVTAAVLPGYVFAENAVTSWKLDLGNIVPCDVIVETVTPTVTPAATCGVGGTLVLPTTEGVTYTSDRPGAQEGIVTVTAVVLPGYAFAEGAVTSWKLDLGQIVPCDVIVETTSPTVTPAATCGVGGEVVLPVTEGVTYTSDRPGVREGVVTVTAAVLPGYAFAEGTVTSWTFDLGTIKACDSIVTPIAPSITAASTCGVGNTVSLPQQEGVVYTVDKPGADHGLVTVTAAPAGGFVFPEGATATWTLDLGSIVPCDVIVALQAPTIKAADTCGVAGKVIAPSIEGVVFDWDKNLTEGAVLVTARVLKGFAFPKDAVTSWTLDLGQIAPCDVIVTAEEPKVSEAKGCGLPRGVVLPKQEGVTYTLDRPDAKAGKVTVTAAVESGFAFAENTATSWTLDLGAIEPCAEELPWTGADVNLTMLLLGVGSALVGTGVVLLLLRRRKRVS